MEENGAFVEKMHQDTPHAAFFDDIKKHGEPRARRGQALGRCNKEDVTLSVALSKTLPGMRILRASNPHF
jgi:hypothetical protein